MCTGLLFLWIGIYFVVMQTIVCKRRVRQQYLDYMEKIEQMFTFFCTFLGDGVILFYSRLGKTALK